MSAIPQIPAGVDTIDKLDRWIEAAAPTCDRAPNEGARLANRLRMLVAVMDRAGEIGARQGGEEVRAL